MSDIISKLNELFDPSNEEEACGLIGATGEVYPVDNVHAEPTKGFRLKPDDMLQLMQEHEITGTWHTHPEGDSTLSQEDYAGFLQWPDLEHYIVSKDGVAKYIVDDGLVLIA